MPNTLAHMGIQAVVTRAGFPRADRGPDLNWIYLACVIPDLPWILQRAIGRALAVAPVEISRYDLRLYAVVQSALFMCLLLAGALACWSRRPWRVFAILALGSLLHLLLDAVQTKWANGVHLFAPVSWELLNFGFFWPEDAPTLALTAFGLGFFIYAWARVPPRPLDLTWPKGRALGVGALCLLAYLALPFIFMPGSEAADNHSVRTLREVGERAGRSVAFDRARYDGTMLHSFAGESFTLEGADLGPAGTLSLRAVFLDRTRLRVEAAHRHWPYARDAFSYLGLALILLTWGRSLRARPRKFSA